MPLEPFSEQFDDLRPYSNKGKMSQEDWVGLTILFFVIILPLMFLLLGLFGFIDLKDFIVNEEHVSTQERYFE